MAFWKKVNMDCFQKATYGVVNFTEQFFYKLGVQIGKKPIKTIVLCWLFVFLSAFGFFRFRQEKNPLKLWVPPHTSFVRDSEWLLQTFQKGFRDESIIITAEDVLTPEIVLQLAEIHTALMHAKTESNITVDNVCFRIPKVDKKLMKMLLPKNEGDLDPSTQMNLALYCSFVEVMKTECYIKTILELWNFNMTQIKSLTKDDIVNKINSFDKNAIDRRLKNYEDLLGGIVRNETGHVVGASALLNIWMVNVNFSAIDMEKAGNLAGTADWASLEALDWENVFLNLMEKYSKKYNNIYYMSGRSFGDISNSSMFQDMDKLIFGVFIMVIYVQLVISKYNWLEARGILGGAGLLAIGMAFVVGCGLCSLFGVYYGPVHTSLPFLLMGLGVDDMFVIMACWNDLSDDQKRLPIPEKVGLMLKHAGVSITITSFTDVVAFLIGSSTILPCLESFCIFAAAGVLMTFIFAVTFFTACFVIDQKRIEASRNGMVPCIVHHNYKPNQCSQSRISNRFFEKLYTKVILTLPGKVIVIIITLVCAGFSIESMLKLEQRFDPRWFLPQESHMAEYLAQIDNSYSNVGFSGGFYMGALNYSIEINKIQAVVENLENMTDIVTNVYSWVNPFRNFVLTNYKHDIYLEPLDDDRFNLFLSKFLFSPRHAGFQANFVFEKELQCGIPAPKIKMSSVDFTFHRYQDPKMQIPAMHRVQDAAADANFTTGDKFSTVWSKYFATWITDELIEIEVMRNLQLALLCVMACTIPLIANWQTCCWIFLCVLVTMVNVCGFMQRWGLTIDLVSCIGLELAIGLCVDYATHIGHTFLTIHEGTLQERSVRTVTSIGSAVVYGGVSTFIGVSMMSFSKAYTFQTFFKIFSLVILFGLFHGIVFLPVMLSWIGPKPYKPHQPVSQTDNIELT